MGFAFARSRWQRLADWPVHHPRVTLGVSVVLVALAVISASRLQPSTSMQTLLSGDDRAAAALDRVMRHFALTDELLLLVEVGGDDAAVGALRRFAAAFEQAVAEDAEVAAMVEHIRSEAAGGDARRFVEREVAPRAALYMDDRAFETFRHRLTAEGMKEMMERNEAMLAAGPAADGTARQVLRDPLRVHELLGDVAGSLRSAGEDGGSGSEFISADGRAMLIRVAGAEPSSDMAFTKSFMPAIRRAIERAKHTLAAEAGRPNAAELHIQPAGAYAIAELSEREIRRDMIRSVVASVLLLQGVFLVAYRRLWFFGLVLAPVAGGITMAFGVYTLTGLPLTPITAVIGAILAGLGVDYAIHYLSHYRGTVGGGSVAQRTAKVNRSLGGAMLAACVTSAVAFAAIGTSSVPALQQFALLGVLGLGAAFVASLTLLPALLVLVQRMVGWIRPRAGDAGDVGAVRFDFVAMLHWVERHRGARGVAIVGLAGLAIGTFATAGFLRFDDDLHAMHPEPNPPLQTQARIAERFGSSPEPIVVHLRAEDEAQLLRRARLVDERITASEAARTAGVQSTFSIARLLPTPARIEARREKLEGIAVDRVLANFDDAIAQSPFDPSAYADYREYLAELVRPDDGPSLDTLRRYEGLADMLLPASEAAADGPSFREAVTLIYLDRSAADRDRRDALIAALRDATAEVSGATLTGLRVIGHDVERSVRMELGRLLTVAAAVVLAWLVLIFRSAADVALVLVPVLVGALVLLTGMQWMGLGFNLMNLVALPLLAGIGVDDGIFLVSAARRAQQAGGASCDADRRSISRDGSSPDAARVAVASSCHAITMTSVTTALAFGSLVLTSTPAIQSLGAVMATGILGCYAGAVGILAPTLMRRTPAPTKPRVGRATC